MLPEFQWQVGFVIKWYNGCADYIYIKDCPFYIGLSSNEKMSSTEDKLVSTTTSDIPPPPYENITFSFDSTPKCLSVEANSSFV